MWTESVNFADIWVLKWSRRLYADCSATKLARAEARSRHILKTLPLELPAVVSPEGLLTSCSAAVCVPCELHRLLKHQHCG